MSDTALEAVLRRDRAVVIVALAIITALAWADLAWLAGDMAMGGMDMTGYRMIPAGRGLMMPTVAPWQPIEFGYVFAMWVVMMIGMMMPSAAPMILIYARVGRQAATQGKPFASSSWFAGGYLLAWTAFSLAATSAQWALERAALLTPMMESASNRLGAAVLILAGLYQWAPLKEACLSHCRSPLLFIQQHGGFRREPLGALALGFRHGIYCIGCCWALMALLFVGGVMNLFWIAVLAILVLLEKIAPFGRQVARIAGLCLIVSGAWLLALAL
jgi:predicted metal-binding membrane protein